VLAFTRRRVLSSLAASLGAVAAGASQLGAPGTATAADEMAGMDHGPASATHSGHSGFALGGAVDSAANGFDPSLIVRDFDSGTTSKLADGRTLREWTLVAADKEIEIAPGVKYAAWTFNGRVPGPTLRCVEGDRLRIHFSNGSAHPHTVHFHGIHPAAMDGVPGLGEEIGGGLIQPGQSFTYEFDAGPFGLHLYHCHASPLAAHIAKGLYGMFIVAPK
jgi:FtsP/CotA-like multicopper oxidase with cupredoxin domain